MASQTKASKIKKLTALPGVGAATAKKLVDAKLDTVSKVASAGATKLIKAGINAAVAKKIATAAKNADKVKFLESAGLPPCWQPRANVPIRCVWVLEQSC